MGTSSDTTLRSVTPTTGMLVGFVIVAAVIVFAFSVVAGYATGRTLAAGDARSAQAGLR